MALLMVDLDNTLVDRQAAFDYWLDRLAGSAPGVAADRAWVLAEDADGVRPREEFLAAVKERFGLTERLGALLADYRRLTTEGFPPLADDVARRLRAGRALGSRVAVVTNGDADAQLATVERTGLAAHLDALVISGAVGVRKPDREIFEIAAQSAGAGLADAWMIGDADVDVQGGRACGARTVWLRRGRRWDPRLTPADHEVDDIADALDLWLNALPSRQS